MTFAPSVDPLLPRLRRAAEHVFGDSPLADAVLQRCDDYEAERNRLLESRGGETPVIAVVGAAGQGKTWLVRAMLHDSALRDALPSGDRASERTRQVAWIGSRPPLNFDPAHERYLSCSNEQMHSFGIPYLLVDTPGLTDVDPAVAAAAREAIHQATAHLLVVRRDQLRAAEIDALAVAGEGALVVPVINIIRQRDEALDPDIRKLLDRIRSLAPTSQILEPVLIDDCEHASQQNQQVPQQAALDISQRIAPYLRELAGGQRIQARLAAARKRFRRDLADQLANQLPELSSAEQRLREAANRLPLEIAESLVGSQETLHVAVRTRLRLVLLNETSVIWFPYRTLLSILNLTHGAWDRLILAMAGSLPSLISTAWSGLTNLRQMADQTTDKTQAVRLRAQQLVQDRLRPVLGAFRRELERLHQGSEKRVPIETSPAHLSGVDALQSASAMIIEEHVRRFAPASLSCQFLAFLGTLLFWLMLAGPIVLLYRQYGGSSLRELTGNAVTIHDFPEPSGAFLVTTFLLSLFPTAIFAMLVMSWVQSRKRVARCAQAILSEHQNAIERLKREETLQLEFDDPLLDDARLLLSIGHTH